MRRLLAIAVGLAAAPAWAQYTEVGAALGYTTPGDIDRKAPQFQELAIEGSFTVGLQGARFFNPHVGLEVTWTRQHSAVSLTNNAGSAELFDVHADQVQASFAYQLGGEDATLQPFVLAGIGATFFGADEPEDETKLAPLLAAGLKWFPYGSGWGVRVEARYSPTHLDDSGSDFCDPFGFCQSWLQQFQFLGGVTLRF